jgi:hypothetical protein
VRTALAVAAALVACVACAVAPAAPSTRESAAPSRLLVSAREWSLTLSRARIGAGRAIVQLHNRGEDDHDLRLRRITRRSVPTARWAVTAPGDLSELALRLAPGRYRLWCSLPRHRALGMRATLRVSRAR